MGQWVQGEILHVRQRLITKKEREEKLRRESELTEQARLETCLCGAVAQAETGVRALIKVEARMERKAGGTSIWTLRATVLEAWL